MTTVEGIAAAGSRGSAGWLRRIHLWRRRARESRELLALSERDLRDIGITRNDAWREANKHFWRE